MRTPTTGRIALVNSPTGWATMRATNSGRRTAMVFGIASVYTNITIVSPTEASVTPRLPKCRSAM
jgi:hypothetical protein